MCLHDFLELAKEYGLSGTDNYQNQLRIQVKLGETAMKLTGLRPGWSRLCITCYVILSVPNSPYSLDLALAKLLAVTLQCKLTVLTEALVVTSRPTRLMDHC